MIYVSSFPLITRDHLMHGKQIYTTFYIVRKICLRIALRTGIMHSCAQTKIRYALYPRAPSRNSFYHHGCQNWNIELSKIVMKIACIMQGAAMSFRAYSIRTYVLCAIIYFRGTLFLMLTYHNILILRIYEYIRFLDS